MTTMTADAPKESATKGWPFVDRRKAADGSHLAPTRRRSDIRERVDRWLFDTVLPHWTHVAVDPENGVFVECLDMDAQPLPEMPRRGRVQPRQLFTLARAHRLGFGDPSDLLPLLECGAETLATNGLTPDRGYASQIDAEGRPTGSDAMLYDHAFVALAGSELQAVGIETGKVLADTAFSLIDTRFRDPETGGFRTIMDEDGDMLANPHMHLLEASLLHHAVTGDVASKDRIEQVATLCADKFISDGTGLLVERLSRDFEPLSDSWVEPGHCYEWAYLLDCAAERLNSEALEAAARKLFERSEPFRESDGLVPDRVRADVPSYRLWPQLERLRCLERFGHPKSVDPLLETIERVYLDRGPDAGWVDKVDARREPTVERVPASMLYHLLTSIPVITRPERKF